MLDQPGIIGTGAVIRRRQLRGAGGIALEQLAVMPLHHIEMAQQVAREGGAALIAEEIRETLHCLGVFGQGMGLLVRDHLQPVLDPSQKDVGRGELVAGLKSDPVARGQHAERFQRRPHPQFRMPAAGDQLLGLREKLDLADTAAPDLDVVALDRDLALAAKGLHLPLHVVNIGESREIQMLAPDEGRDFRHQRLAGPGVAGAGPRLDHGGALPGPAVPLVVMQRRGHRDRHLRRGWIRPQPQIDPEHVAVAVALLQDPRKRLGDAHEEGLRLDVGRQRPRFGIEEHDQVDVAGIIQLARTHLAHGEHDEAAVVLGRIDTGRHQPAALGLLPQQKAQRRLHRGDREIGQRRRDLHDRPEPADIAQRDQQRRFRFHAAKQLHHVGFGRRGRDVAAGVFDQPGQMRLRLAFEQPDRARGVGAQEIEQIGRGLGDAEKNRSGARKPAGQAVDRSRLRRRQIRQPVCQSLFGLIGCGHMRSVHEPRGQTMLVRVALRG